MDVARDVPRDHGVDAPAARDLGGDDGPAFVDLGRDTGAPTADATADAAMTPTPVEDAGCGCRTPPERSRTGHGWLLALAALGLRRRRGSDAVA